ncbi:MAG TPA: hypothetical protein VIQ29_19365 [Ancylobacter sp.]
MDMFGNGPAHTPIAIKDTEAPLGRDAGRDSAHNRAAVAIFGIGGIAVIAVALSCYALGGSEPEWPTAIRLTQPLGVALDSDGAAQKFTIFDAATGLSETVTVVPERDTAEATPAHAGAPVAR